MRLLHFADLHLGIEAYGHIDPSTGLHTRVQDFVRSLEFVIDLAIRQTVDLVLFAGDAYKNCDPSPTHQRELACQIRRLQQAAIPLVIVVGNHDTPTAFGKATSVDIFTALGIEDTWVIRRPQLLEVETRGGPLQIAGLPWPTRHLLRTHEAYKDLPQAAVNEKIIEICQTQIDEFARQLNPQQPAVLMAHITAAEAALSGSERTALIGQDPTLLTSALANPAFSYVALGHVHKHQNLNPDASPPVVYAGSIERITFGEEFDEKGVCLVTLEQDPTSGQGPWRASYEFIPTDCRRFTTIQADIPSGAEDPTQILLDAVTTAQITDAIVRLIYTYPADGRYAVDLTRIHTALQAAHHIAGIIPKAAVPAKIRRASIAEDLILKDALDRYIDNNPNLEAHRLILQRYASELERELDMSPAKDAS
jgi:exonuclease SbcD